jgi:hypothetical protein
VSAARPLLLAGLVLACSAEGNAPDDGGPPGLIPVTFTHLPLRIEDIDHITPLGALNPPAHTIPNDHIQFAYVDPDRCPCDLDTQRPVFAPASGTVRLVLRGQDDGLEVGQPPNQPGSERHPWYYMGHVLLRPDIRVGTTLTAGEQIGTTGRFAVAVDLGLVNPEAQNTFVVRARYHDKALFGDKPLRHFVEPHRTTLYGRVRRAGQEKDGRFDYDVPGRLTGGWFHQSLPRSNVSTGPEGWSRQLAFVYWERDPSIALVTIGGTILPPLVYWLATGAPAFDQVSVASGRVTIGLHIARPSPAIPREPDHTLLVQLLADDRLMVEAFPRAAVVSGFTASAMTYLR